jgi:hypothetical protein
MSAAAPRIVNGHDGHGRLGDGRLHGAGIHRQALVDVNEDRHRAQRYHSVDRRHPRIGRDDHLVARSDAEGGETDEQGAGSRRDGQRMPHSHRRRELLLELCGLVARPRAVVPVETLAV